MFYLRDGNGPRYEPCKHAQTARRNALVYASAKGEPVTVETDVRVVFIAHPDGRITPPADALVPERAVCVASEGKTCFCLPCRASRRSQ